MLDSGVTRVFNDPHERVSWTHGVITCECAPGTPCAHRDTLLRELHELAAPMEVV